MMYFLITSVYAFSSVPSNAGSTRASLPILIKFLKKIKMVTIFMLKK